MADEAQAKATTDASRPIGVPLRILAVLLAAVLAFFTSAIIAGASDNSSLPTCRAVNHHEEALPESGDCFDGSSSRATLGLVAAILAGLTAAGALIVAVMAAATGRWGQLLLILGGMTIVFILLEIAIVHL